MDAEKIIQDLNRRFAAPLPEFYKRRIIVWIDEDQEFADKLDEITVNGAKVVALTGTNNFYVKKLLAVDDPTSNYLVYRPFAYESDEDNWLLDVELYGEEFRADLVSMWMDEMGIPQTPALRRGFKQYRKFFNAQARRNKVSAQPVTPATPAQLQMAIMAALAGLKDAKPNAIIKAVLQGGRGLLAHGSAGHRIPGHGFRSCAACHAYPADSLYPDDAAGVPRRTADVHLLCAPGVLL